MHIQHLRNTLCAFALGLGLMLASGWAYADPPLRVARLGYTEGQVSFSPAGKPDWVQSAVNRPLTTGDRLWVDTRSRAELQIGGSAIRLGENTNVTLLNVDDSITQVQLTQGTLKLHVRRVDANQILEIDTPNLALTVHKAGDYRLDVSPSGDATEVSVLGGEAEVYGDGASYVVRGGQGYRFFGTGLSDYENLTARVDDDLDRWARERERRIDASASARYVSSELVGYEDLDANGTWSADPTYGYVWVPSRVAVGWTPYHDGHWAWVNPWGWTWVDAAPWGYAVTHYGRWAHIRGAWAWVPGPVRERAVYAPALVVFLGGTQFQGGAVGWFPLAPREVYQPGYHVSHGYFDRINRSNAVIAPATITNIYNTHITNVTRVTYVNRNVTGAVVAVPMHAFAHSQSVAKAVMPLPRDAAGRATVTPTATVAPVVQSVHGGAPDASAKPPAHEHHVVARTAPPAAPIAFAAQQPQLAAKPGAPLDDQRRAQLKPAAPAEPTPQVKLVTHTKPPIASAVPPPAPPRHGRPTDEHRPEVPKTIPVQTIEPPKAVEPRADASAAAAAAAAAHAEAAKAAAAAAAQADKVRAEADKSKAARDEAVKANAAKEEGARADAARAAAAKAQADNHAKQAREEAGRADAARAAAAKAEADKAKAVREEAARANAAKEAAAHAAAARAQADHNARAAKEEAARAHAARVEAAKPTAAPAPAPAPAHADAQGHHAAKPEHASKPGEKKDKSDEDAKKH